VSYTRRVLNALSQLFNAAVGGNIDVMASARAHREGVLAKHWFWTPLAWVLNRIDPGHTARAYEADKDEWKTH